MNGNPETILDAIRALHGSGAELNYSSVHRRHQSLVRGAEFHFGTWKRAVERAGFCYDTVSRYQKWTRERVVDAIRAHHRAGHDLSWRAVSTRVDPPLAAAALRPNSGFATWHDAVLAAGLDPERLSRYRHWTPKRVVSEIRQLARRGGGLSSKGVRMQHAALYCAARRRFGSWDAALVAAGFDPCEVRLRRSSARAQTQRNGEAAFISALVRPEAAPNDARKRRSPRKIAHPVSTSNGAPVPRPHAERPNAPQLW